MNSIFRKLKIFTLWIGGIVLLLVAILEAFSFCVTYPYYKVEIGMSEDQVIEIFGESRPLADRGEKPSLCEMNVWYGDCKAVQNSQATYFLTFKVFFDTYAIIGFKNKKVTYKGIGDA
jgi:hypothetical protein